MDQGPKTKMKRPAVVKGTKREAEKNTENKEHPGNTTPEDLTFDVVCFSVDRTVFSIVSISTSLSSCELTSITSANSGHHIEQINTRLHIALGQDAGNV